ncbi:MAG TPA: DUF2127 domain-containing protein [Candidatus Dormibacteraeota bacterium]|nr:DUF2127 domain-containing protein [Candidatus Dormibacteraeota bacterium]
MPGNKGGKKHSLLDRSFRFGIALKGLDGLLEMVLGIAILNVNPQGLAGFLSTLLHPELVEDPNDFVATHLLRAAQHFGAGGKHFASFYLLSHGIIKILLIAALFKNKLWAYPALIVTLSAFVFYQGYRFVLTHSLMMIFLTLFDIAIIALTWLEYKKQKARVAGNQTDS